MLFIMFSTLLRNKCMLTIVNAYRGRSHLSYMLLFMMECVSLIANAYGALLKRLHCSPLLKIRSVDSLKIDGGYFVLFSTLYLNFNIF